MVPSAAGAVVLVPFPFTDLTQAKLRPAVALADAGRGDWILPQVTSKPYGDPRAIQLTESSFRSGSLRIVSYVRPGKLFMANDTLIVPQVGVLTDGALHEIITALMTILSGSGSAEQREYGPRG